MPNISCRRCTELVVAVFILFSWCAECRAERADTSWTRSYNGTGGGADAVNCMAIDHEGNILVTGGSPGGASSGLDFVTIKYSPSGSVFWTRRYNGTASGQDFPRKVTCDGIGSVYVTGDSEGSSGATDYLTIKYKKNGDVGWVRRYDGPGASYDVPEALVIDDSGSVVVTGFSSGSDMAYSCTTIKYDANGDTLWVRRYRTPSGSSDYGNDLVVDGSGNFIVAGITSGNGTAGQDFLTIKYLSNGDTAWVRHYNGDASGPDWVSKCAVDKSENIYVTGYSEGVGTNWDFVTVKYTPSGDVAWIRRLNGIANLVDWPFAMIVDELSNVFISGSSVSGPSRDFLTVKYDSTGAEKWTKRFNGFGDGDDEPSSMAIDTSGCVYVTGYSLNGGSGTDIATIKYSPSGDVIWVEYYDAESNGHEYSYPAAICLDDSGYVYVSGSSYIIGSTDFLTLRYVQYRRGDTDHNSFVSVSDVVYLINYIFASGQAPIPPASGDANCSGAISISDVVFLINYIFAGGAVPCEE